MKLVISAGDPSGDIRAGEVLRALSHMCDDLEVSGLGGDNIAASGGNILFHLHDYSVMGFTEVIASLSKLRRLRKSMKELILSVDPDAVLLVDYPGFNIPLALWARSMGFKVIYYISPQLWAWGHRRVRKIRRSVHLMITLFDFEVEFYSRHGVRAACAGHPLVDSVAEPVQSTAGGELALLPGSRAQEVEMLLPPMLEAFSMLRCDGAVTECAVSRSSSVPEALYLKAANTPGVRIESSIGDSLANASAAVVCSGTATLETALWGIPMVITYKTSILTFLLARLLVRGIRRIGMVNIVVKGNENIAPELIQSDVTPENIVTGIQPLLQQSDERTAALKGLESVRIALGVSGAAERAAQLIFDECDDEKA